MRSSRVLVLTLVVSLLAAAAPSAFATVCHPKKPITCQATHFSSLGSIATPAAVQAPAKAKATAVKAKQPKVQQAMICGPWVKWMCTAQPLV